MTSPDPRPPAGTNPLLRQGKPVSRRGFLAAGGALGGALLLSACGGTSKPPNAAPPAATGSAAGGATYSGPKVTVKFWNGWTGADGEIAQLPGETLTLRSSHRSEVDTRVIPRVWPVALLT